MESTNQDLRGNDGYGKNLYDEQTDSTTTTTSTTTTAASTTTTAKKQEKNSPKTGDNGVAAASAGITVAFVLIGLCVVTRRRRED